MPKIVDRDAKRREIIEAAVATIAERGLDGATLKLIAERAGATTGTIGHYFLDKDELIVATLDHLADSIIGEHATPGNFASGGLRLVLPLEGEASQLWQVWLAYCGAAPSSPRLLAAYEAFYARVEVAIADQLRATAVADAELVAASIVAAVDGIGLCATVAPRLWPADRQRTVMQRILDGLVPTPADARTD